MLKPRPDPRQSAADVSNGVEDKAKKGAYVSSRPKGCLQWFRMYAHTFTSGGTLGSNFQRNVESEGAVSANL